MKFRPILFNGAMVHAILDGRKTQTRRAVKPRPFLDKDGWWQVGKAVWPVSHWRLFYQEGDPLWNCAPCKPGDILWVRETWTPFCLNKKTARGSVLAHSDFCYKASPEGCMDEYGCKWHPSIHMPKEAARIFLRVKDVRLEMLERISPEDCESEGAVVINNPFIREDKDTYKAVARKEMASLWNSTLKPAARFIYGWEANPWVWVIEFERCDKPEGWC